MGIFSVNNIELSFNALLFSVLIATCVGFIVAEDNGVNGTSGFRESLQDFTTKNSNNSHSFQNATKYAYDRGWGSEGSGDGQFQRIHDLDFNPNETLLYVVDRDNSRIQVFDKMGNFKFKWPQTTTKGNADGQFRVPYSVDVDSKGDVWVADRNNNRIQKFDKDGMFLFKFGSSGTGNGEFNLPRQIAVDRTVQFLYVVDSENHRVQVFDSSGKYIKQWGGKGNSDGKFNLPISIVMDNNGDLIVNDRGTGRVQKFDRDGNLILKFGSIGNGPSQFGIAEHMGVDKYNNIYIDNAGSEAGVDSQAKVMKFSPTGKFITKWGTKGEFVDPEHLAIDSKGNVYVSDRGNNNIQVFKPVVE